MAIFQFAMLNHQRVYVYIQQIPLSLVNLLDTTKLDLIIGFHGGFGK